MYKRILSIAVLVVITSISMWLAHGYISEKDDFVDSEISEIVSDTRADIRVWYIDEKVLPFLEEVSKTYRSGVEITYEQKSSLDFFENMDKLNRAKEKAPDLYIVDSALLEKACYAGLAKENVFEDIYKEENYSDIALSAGTYQDVLYGYPLYFETSFLVYNEDYVAKEPKTIEEILVYSEETDTSSYEKLENIFKWNVNDLLYNYGFLGSYIDVGGKNGDQKEVVELNAEGLKGSLAYYQSLQHFFSIDMDIINDSVVTEEFINGKTAFILTNLYELSKIRNSEINYKLSVYPELTNDLESTAMASTKLILVNPYSSKIREAEKIARYMSFEKSNLIYEKTQNIMGTRKIVDESDEDLEIIMSQYENSKNLPKLMDKLDLYIRLDNSLKAVWSGSSVDEVVATLEEGIK